MSQENVNLMLEAYEAFNRRDWDDFLGWHPVRWRDGKAVWWRNCSTEKEALEAAGLEK